MARPCEAGAALPRQEYLHYLHRLSIWLALFKFASNMSRILAITRIVQIVWIFRLVWVFTCIICMTYASNSKYLLILLVIFELFESMRVLNSNTHIDSYLCEYSTHITCIDSTRLAYYSPRKASKWFFLYIWFPNNEVRALVEWLRQIYHYREVPRLIFMS